MSEGIKGGESVVWEDTVDGGEFTVSVTRNSSYKGQLRVRVAATGEVLLDEEVGLAYQAIFGPDMADVEDWEERGIEVIDEWIERQKKS